MIDQGLEARYLQVEYIDACTELAFDYLNLFNQHHCLSINLSLIDVHVVES